MQESATFKILVHLNEFQDQEQLLIKEYPFVYNSLPYGIVDILYSALSSFMFKEHDAGVYLEECVNVIDYLINEEEDNNQPMIDIFGSSKMDIYKPEFYDLLMSIFNRLEEVLKNVLATSNFVITEHDSLVYKPKVLVTIQIGNE